MRYTWYPIFLDPDATPKVKKFIRKDLKMYPDLLLRVQDFLKEVKQVTSLDQYYKTGEMEKIKGRLHEMRIPPKRRGGVVRIYFCVNPEDAQELILLDAELKHETAPGRTEIASKRLSEYQEYLRKRKKK